MVGHQAVAEEAEGVAELRLAEQSEEGAAVGVVEEDVAAVVAAAEGMEGEAVVVGSEWSCHAQGIGHALGRGRKTELTPIWALDG